MIRTLVLCLLISLNLSSLQAKDKLSSHISTFNDVVKKAGTVDYNKNCTSINSSNSTAKYSLEKSTITSKLNKKTIELSVLSEKYAQEVFNTLKNDEENSFNYPLDGCYARAAKMAMDMDNMGIISGKAFVEGDLLVDTKLGEANWSYHVASLVFVKVKNKLVPTVLDPSLFDKPVSYDQWKSRLLAKKGSKFQSEYFTKRFNYDPDSRYDDMESYQDDQVEDMKEAIRKNRTTGEVLQSMYGDE